MNILLFNQYFTAKKDSPDNATATLPINLLYLASYLEFKGLKSKICELGIFDSNKTVLEKNKKRIRYGKDDYKITRLIKKECPKIIGIGCVYSRHYIDVINISRLIKKIDPSIITVVGGNHATSFHNMIVKELAIDIVVRGEGEITFYELCQKILTGKKNLSNIKGLTYKDDKNNVIVNPPRELIKNLDDLPPLNYELVDIRSYANLSYNSPYFMRYPGIGIVSSRGCPGNCIYCTVKAVWGRIWRAKSAKKTVDEIELLHIKYGINEFAFLDDSASVDIKRWNEICNEIIKRKLDVRWTTPNGIAHWTLDKPTLLKMKRAGCYRITFGIESGNSETRKFLGKPYPLKQAGELIQFANKIGMWTICTHILGFPYETKKSMEDTIRFAKKSGTDFATFYLLWPMVNSDVYNYFKKENLLNFDYIFQNNYFDMKQYNEMDRVLNDEGAPTKFFTAEELKKIQLRAYRNFFIYRAITFLNPLKIARKIKSFEDLKYTLKLIFAGVKLILRTFYTKTSRSLIYKQEKVTT